MNGKKRRFDTRTTLIVLFVIVIIISAYLLIINLPVQEKYLTPEGVASNIQQYLNKTIVVEGYYQPELDGGAMVSKPTDQISGSQTSWLRVDISKVGGLTTDIKYHLTGVVTQLVQGSSPTPIYELLVEKVEQV
jgi:hypothetical protein